MRSYTSHDPTSLSWFRDVVRMARSNRSARGGPADVAGHIAILRAAEAAVEQYTGMVIEGLKVLDIGAGQLAAHLSYFAAKNDAVGIDLDVHPRRFRPWDWLTLLRRNGIRRLAKTAGRRMLGVDTRYRAEIGRQLGVSRLAEPHILYMDAEHMSFADGSFDFVYSFDVFEHLSNPRQTLREAVRVVRPGGAIYISVHHWSNDNGCHDLRVINGARGDIPHWPHLRPASSVGFQRGAFCNELTVPAWRTLFEQLMPGGHVAFTSSDEPALAMALRDARTAGELADFTDAELLAHRLTVVWQKPKG